MAGTQELEPITCTSQSQDCNPSTPLGDADNLNTMPNAHSSFLNTLASYFVVVRNDISHGSCIICCGHIPTYYFLFGTKILDNSDYSPLPPVLLASVILCFWNTSSLSVEPLVWSAWKYEKILQLFKTLQNKLEHCCLTCLSPDKRIILCWHWIQNKTQKFTFLVLLVFWPLFEFETKLYQTTEFTQ